MNPLLQSLLYSCLEVAKFTDPVSYIRQFSKVQELQDKAFEKFQEIRA